MVPVRRGTVRVLTEVWFGRGRRDSSAVGSGGTVNGGGFGSGVGHGGELGDLETEESKEESRERKRGVSALLLCTTKRICEFAWDWFLSSSSTSSSSSNFYLFVKK